MSGQREADRVGWGGWIALVIPGGEDRVADVVADRPTVTADKAAQLAEERADNVSHRDATVPLRQSRIADDVADDDRQARSTGFHDRRAAQTPWQRSGDRR